MSIALTPLGKMLRKLRIDACERIADLAKELGCTSSFVSAVELGKKSPPEGFISSVIAHYQLDELQAAELRSAASRSVSSVRIDLENSNDLSKEFAVAFARAFPTIDSEKAEQLLKTLSGKG